MRISPLKISTEVQGNYRNSLATPTDPHDLPLKMTEPTWRRVDTESGETIFQDQLPSIKRRTN